MSAGVRTTASNMRAKGTSAPLPIAEDRLRSVPSWKNRARGTMETEMNLTASTSLPITRSPNSPGKKDVASSPVKKRYSGSANPLSQDEDAQFLAEIDIPSANSSMSSVNTMGLSTVDSRRSSAVSQRNTFTVQYVSTSCCRRATEAAGRFPSPTPLVPNPSKNCRTDLLGTTMADQCAMAWQEEQQRLPQSCDRDFEAVTFAGDSKTESLALQLMVAEAVRRQALATPGESMRFVRTIGHAKVRNHQNATGKADPHTPIPICTFKDIYSQLLSDVTMFLGEYGYAKTVKSFLQIRPWVFV